MAGPWRPAVGITPTLSDAELITLAVMSAPLGYTSERRWLRRVGRDFGHLFPYVPQQSGYNKRLRAAFSLLTSMIRIVARDTSLWSDDVWLVDSTPVGCGCSRETAKCSDLAGWAQYGYCASHSRYFWGLRLHLVCTLGGLPVLFALTGARADERETLRDMLDTAPDVLAVQAAAAGHRVDQSDLQGAAQPGTTRRQEPGRGVSPGLVPDPRTHSGDLAQRPDWTAHQAVTHCLRSLTARHPLDSFI